MSLFNEKSDALRRRMLKPWSFRAYLAAKLPLAAAAGLRLRQLDDEACVVSLPGGWRTQNPFGSAYFAAQAMAAEMSTGAPALVLCSGAPASVAMIVREFRGTFDKRVLGPSTYTCADVAGFADAIARAAAGDEAVSFTARSQVTNAEGEAASAFEVTWSFKRRTRR